MKTVVSFQDLLEFEIRPDAVLAGYQERLARDVASRWTQGARDVPCPGCGGTRLGPAFERLGVAYCECLECASLFASPRPAEAVIVDLYRRGEAARFWREEVWPQTQAARREKLVQPRADWVLDGLAEHAPGSSTGLDMSPYGAPLLNELCDGTRRMIAGFWLADYDVPSPPPGARVQPLLLDAMSGVGPVDFVTAFDLFDRAPDVPALVDALAAVVRPGGLLFLTASSADGFDVQVLWEKMAIAPPDKMNLLSIDGLLRRFGSSGWDIIELSTPGMFDVEHVRRAVEVEPQAPWPRFVRRLMTRGAGDPSALADFQQYLQRHRLASFARVLLRRRSA